MIIIIPILILQVSAENKVFTLADGSEIPYKMMFVYPPASSEYSERIKLIIPGPQQVVTPIGKVKVKDFIWVSHRRVIETIKLAGPARIDTPAGKWKCDNGDLIGFNEDGLLSSVHANRKLSVKTPIGNVTTREGRSSIHLYRNGKISKISNFEMFEASSKFGTLYITEALHLYRNGTLKFCYLHPKTRLKTPIGEVNCIRTEFFEDGSPIMLNLHNSGAYEIVTPIGKVKINATIELYGSWRIKKCYWTTEKATLNKKGRKYTITKGMTLEFYENGTVKGMKR